MALNTLPAGAFADDAISSDKINLANNFAFTGTVSGASDYVEFFIYQEAGSSVDLDSNNQNTYAYGYRLIGA